MAIEFEDGWGRHYWQPELSTGELAWDCTTHYGTNRVLWGSAKPESIWTASVERKLYRSLKRAERAARREERRRERVQKNQIRRVV